MLRVLAGGLLCVGAAAGGVLIRRHYNDKAALAGEIAAFISALKNKIKFLKTPLLDATSEFISQKEGKKSRFCDILKSFKEAKASGKPFQPDTGLLSAEDKTELENFFASIGKSNVEITVENLKYFESYFLNSFEKRKEEAKRLGGMYFKLMTLLGIALMIIVA